MALEQQLNLKPGKWLVANCGNLPSESNCQLVMLAPEDKREDLIAASATHAVNKHGHKDSAELRKGVEDLIQTMEVAG